MKTKFAFMLLGLFLLLNIDAFCEDLKWISSSTRGGDRKLNKLSSNGDYYLIHDAVIKIFNTRQGKLVTAIEDKSKINQNIINYEFSNDNQNLFILFNNQLQIWNIKNATLFNEYELKESGNEFEFISIEKPINQDFFVGLGYNTNEPNNYKVITWDIENFNIRNSFNVDLDEYKLYSLDISPNGKFLCIRLHNSSSIFEPEFSNKNKIYSINEGQLVKEINSNLYSTKFSNNYFICFTSNKINLYDLIDFSFKQEVNCLISDYSYSNQFDISQDGNYLLFINYNNENQLDVYNIESKEVEYSLNPKFTTLDIFKFVNEDTIIIEKRNEYIPMAELIKGKTNTYIRQVLNGSTAIVSSMCFSKDGNYLWVLYPYGNLSMYETSTGRLIKNILFDYYPIYKGIIAIENENNYIAISGEDQGIRIVNTNNETVTYFNTENYSHFFELDFSSDRKYLLSASYKDSVVIIWDIESKAIKKIKKLDFLISKAFYSYDENNVYILSPVETTDGSKLYKWDLSNDELTSKQIDFYSSLNYIPTVSDDKRYIVNYNSVYDIFSDELSYFSANWGKSGVAISKNNNYFVFTNPGTAQDSVFIRVLDWKNDKIIKEYSLFNYVAITGDVSTARYQNSYLPRISPNNEYVAAISQLQDIALFKFDTTSSAVEEYQEINTYEAKVFPNPASNIINLDLSLPVSGVVNVTIRDVQGVAVIENYSEFFASGKANVPFNLPKLASGMYYVTVSFNTETTTIPLIIIN